MSLCATLHQNEILTEDLHILPSAQLSTAATTFPSALTTDDNNQDNHLDDQFLDQFPDVAVLFVDPETL